MKASIKQAGLAMQVDEHSPNLTLTLTTRNPFYYNNIKTAGGARINAQR